MQSKNFMQMYFLNELKTDFMFGINIFELAFWMRIIIYLKEDKIISISTIYYNLDYYEVHEVSLNGCIHKFTFFINIFDFNFIQGNFI